MNKPQLFAVTQPRINERGQEVVCPENMMSAEESIVWMARVSSPKQRTEEANKLLLFLVKHGHWSPFDMVDMTVEIQTSRAIMAQILRHWSFRFQEFSQRYSEVPETSWDHVEAREKAVGGNRQGSGEIHLGATDIMQDGCAAAEEIYRNLVEQNNIAPEAARMVMPLATATRAYMKGSIRSWMTYFWQRLDPHAQKEHRELALQMFDIFKAEFPVIADLVLKYKPQVVEQSIPITEFG